MGHRPLLRPFLLPLACLATLGAACSTTETTDDRNELETAVLVDPAEFLGAFPCADDIDGAPKSYIATVIDLDADPPEEIARSPRVGCSTPLAFSNVIVGHHYSASIEVFEAPPGDAALDRWTTLICGAEESKGAALAQSLKQVTITQCDALTGPGLGETAIVVEPRDALGSLGCTGDEAGGLVFEVDVIPIAPAGSGLPTVTLACDEGPVTFGGEEIEPGVTYTFRLEAVDFPLEQFWGATCSATAFEGLGVHTTCSTLTDLGTIVFPLAELLDGAELSCGAGVTRAKIALFDGEVLVSEAITDCEGDATIPGLLAGEYTATIELFDAAQSVAIYSCETTLEPGANATLECEASP